MHLTYYIEVNPELRELFLSDFFDEDDRMDTILDMTNIFMFYVCFRCLWTDFAWDNIVFSSSCL